MGQLCEFNESGQEVAECTGKGSVSGEMKIGQAMGQPRKFNESGRAVLAKVQSLAR
jgi:hypothetical protein